MRGAPMVSPCDAPWLRIIPADAGSTQASICPSTTSGDHPRGCGEHCCHLNRFSICEGSSPRMRGAPDPGHDRHRHAGIIPADAGSTNFSPASLVSWSDHPRGCGEHILSRGPCNVPEGSSPRMRGARRHGHMGCHIPGIIPADAGSTCSLCLSSSLL